MKVPVVVQIARPITTHIATEGPEIHSQMLRPRISALAQAGCRPEGAERDVEQARESLNHAGPSMPTRASRALTAPEFWKRKRKTTLMAIELVTEGK